MARIVPGFEKFGEPSAFDGPLKELVLGAYRKLAVCLVSFDSTLDGGVACAYQAHENRLVSDVTKV